MTYADEIFSAACLMDAEADRKVLQLMSPAAAVQLQARLAPGISPELCREAFVAAGGFLALALCEAAGKGGGMSGFEAGDFSVTLGQSREKSLLAQAEQLMAPYLQDGFSFAGVAG